MQRPFSSKPTRRIPRHQLGPRHHNGRRNHRPTCLQTPLQRQTPVQRRRLGSSLGHCRRTALRHCQSTRSCKQRPGQRCVDVESGPDLRLCHVLLHSGDIIPDCHFLGEDDTAGVLSDHLSERQHRNVDATPTLELNGVQYCPGDSVCIPGYIPM